MKDEILRYLFKQRLILVVGFVLSVVCGVIVTFLLIKKEYSSQVTFLPPSSESSLPASLSGYGVGALLGTNLGSSNSEQLEIVFNSKDYKKKIIDKFNLYTSFKLEKSQNKLELAIKALDEYLYLTPIEKGSMGFDKTIGYSVKSYSTSPDTAYYIAKYAYDILDSTIKAISIDKARRNRIFIDDQLLVNKQKLDSLQKKFNEFQAKNKAYNIPEQISLSLNAYSQIKASSLVNEMKLKTLESSFSSSVLEIEELRKKQQVFRKQLEMFEKKDNADIFMGFDQSSKLMPEYTNMMRDLEIQNQVILLLSREYEQAKLQEARDISSLIVIDPPIIPEYKARPKRVIVLMAITMVEFSLLLFILLNIFLFKKYRNRINLYLQNLQK